MTKEGSTKIVYIFHDPRAGVLVLGCGQILSHIVKMHYFLKKYSSLFPGIDQTNYAYGNDDQGREYQNCIFHDPRGRGYCTRAWPYKLYSENA